MTDRETVIKELENYEPYARVFSNITVTGSVVLDALSLLKEQEDHIGVLQRAIEQMPKPTKLLDVYGDGYAKVVRCKDCKHYMTIHCICDGCCISDDWFCADAERKEGSLNELSKPD